MFIEPNPNFFSSDFPNLPEYELLIELSGCEQSDSGFFYQSSNIITLSPSWNRIFNIPEGDIFLLEDYLCLFDADSKIIRERDSLQSGQRWSGTIKINGIPTKSFAIASDDNIIGVDIILKMIRFPFPLQKFENFLKEYFDTPRK